MTWLHPTATIIDLLDDQSGKRVSAITRLSGDRTDVLRFKHGLQIARVEGRALVRCEDCGMPVYLAAMPDAQTFVFRHFVEDGSCPHITRESRSAASILAAKYHGQRESSRHKHLKQLMADSIECDRRFSKPEIELTWRGEANAYRRPDVRARFEDQADIAFEIQLSTTFGSVMAEREVFYRKNGGQLLWVFGEFDPAHARMTMETVYRVNNRNAYVVNEETLAASQAAGCLMLLCYWEQPSMGDKGVVWTSRRRLVRFDELTIDQPRQRVYLIDTDGLQAQLQRQLDGPSLAERLEEQWLTINEFQGRKGPDWAERDRQWRELQGAFNRCRLSLPQMGDKAMSALFNALYSAKHGASVGWRFTTLWDAAHHVMTQERQFAWIFYAALEAYGRLRSIEELDKGSWAKKVANWRRRIEGWQGVVEEHRFDPLINEAFPELAAYVSAQRGDLEEWEEAPF